eukprot:CAMPEP_0115862252 /NCGR_PEP_ID=MMETSP0287-20121206/18079_1 /TAXON_ID=412157 /ORGANISM="Chrysochromulina rotalis, Strain UIO044" /LENGTH=57 /DNA_ID=CAMNT_0003316665 /DNA_START=328 /DNA_END=501 /DNA_ORIENTATION=+
MSGILPLSAVVAAGAVGQHLITGATTGYTRHRRRLLSSGKHQATAQPILHWPGTWPA